MSGACNPGGSTGAQAADPIVVKFQEADDVGRTPDHDPHGEHPAMAARSHASCDAPGCETSGLVSTHVLEEADGYLGGPKRDVVCEDCG